jgi:hypothetical protein
VRPCLTYPGLAITACCCSVLKYPDWVYSVVARGGLLLVASGPEVHVHDLPTGKLVRKVSCLHGALLLMPG